MVNYTLLCSNREMDIFLSKKDCIIFQIHFSDCLQTILFPQALSISIFLFLIWNTSYKLILSREKRQVGLSVIFVDSEWNDNFRFYEKSCSQ